MRSILKFEEAAMFGVSIFIFAQTSFEWWWYPALILMPDIGMIGYAAGPKAGAVSYNIFHHKGIAIAVFCLGWYLSSSWLELAGIILFGHASMDRIFGYGLKYRDSFHHTHLGWMKGADNYDQ